MYKFVNFCNLMRPENLKESTDYVKTIDFRQMYMKFGIATSKNHEHTIDIKISARGE